MEPEITVLVHVPGVAGDQPVADKLVARGFRLVQIFEQHHRVRPLTGNVPFFTGRQLIAVIVDNGANRTRRRSPYRARLDREHVAVVAENDVALRLPEAFVDFDVQFTVGPFEQFLADGLPA